MVSPWPSSRGAADEYAIEGFEVLQALVKSIRAVRTEYKVESKASISVIVNFSKKGLSEKNLQFSDFSSEIDSIALLSRVNVDMMEFKLVEDIGQEVDETCVHVVVNNVCEVFIPLRSIMDKEKERKRIVKQIDKLSKNIVVLKERLENKNFVAKAPEKLIEESTRTLREQEAVLDTLKSGLRKIDEQ